MPSRGAASKVLQRKSKHAPSVAANTATFIVIIQAGDVHKHSYVFTGVQKCSRTFKNVQDSLGFDRLQFCLLGKNLYSSQGQNEV